MNRAAALAYIVGQYGSGANALLGLADIPATDTGGGLKDPIDDAALLLGVGYGDLASFSVSNVIGFRAALEYVTLKRIIKGLRGNKSIMGVAAVGNGVSLDVRATIAALQADLAVAAAEARAAGVDIPTGTDAGGWPSGSWSLAGINLDYLEPEANP